MVWEKLGFTWFNPTYETVAATRYEGAEPEAARYWVEANVERGSIEATFGNVPYSLSGEPNAKTLTMGVFRW